MAETIITQGSFTATGTPYMLPVRSDVDWLRVTNLTQSIARTATSAVEFYWQRGFDANEAIVYERNAGATAIDVLTSSYIRTLDGNNAYVGGFTVYDSSVQTPGPAVVTTGYAGANPPVITTATTTGLIANTSVVRLAGMAAAPTLCGIDFWVTAVTDGISFTLPTLVNAVAAGGAGTYRIIPFNPIFYPRNRILCNVTRAANAVVTTNVPHGYTVGQLVRFNVPAVNSMIQLNGLTGTVVAAGVGAQANQFTVDIDTTAFTAFTWPLIAVSPNSFAQVIPVGETANATYANLLNDATLNTGELGIIFGAGVDDATNLRAPAGTAGDTIYWVAGKSWNM